MWDLWVLSELWQLRLVRKINFFPDIPDLSLIDFCYHVTITELLSCFFFCQIILLLIWIGFCKIMFNFVHRFIHNLIIWYICIQKYLKKIFYKENIIFKKYNIFTPISYWRDSSIYHCAPSYWLNHIG